ncbi:MAG: hypothetical protein LBU48_04185 [Coriobacteriales bacterium]|nr:hypothetical protein [Coriobacteriales bacterium]
MIDDLAVILSEGESYTVEFKGTPDKSLPSEVCFTNAGALFFRTNDEDVMFRHAGTVCALYKGTDKAYLGENRVDCKRY